MLSNNKKEMMKCRRTKKSIWFYLEDSLSPDQKSAAEEHLSQCASCREILEKMRPFVEELEQRKQLDSNPYFFTRVQQRLENTTVRDTSSRRYSPVHWVVIPLTICIGLLLGIGLITQSQWSQTGQNEDQVNTLDTEEIFFMGDLDETAFDAYFGTDENNVTE